MKLHICKSCGKTHKSKLYPLCSKCRQKAFDGGGKPQPKLVK